MAAPPKPWERVGINYQNNPSLPSNSMSGAIGIESLNNPAGSAVTPGAFASPVQTSSPPQLPPRPAQQSLYTNRFSSPSYGYGGYSSLSNPYSFGNGNYGGGMYNSPYSSYGGYNNFNNSHQVTSSFARQAEENSRPAFESIESIVHAVSSVGMMLDSTFSAVYNSFRAVIGVADNFARLKFQLVQVFSTLAFIRSLRYIVRKILEFLRLRPKGEAEAEWKKAFSAAAAAAASPDNGPKRSSWPILMFFGIIMGGPYLIWKLISKFSSQEDGSWSNGKEDHFVAKANFNFTAQGSEELSFKAGQQIRIAPKELQPRVRGWLLGSVDGNTTGLIPANYVSILGKRRGQKEEEQHCDVSQSDIKSPPSLTSPLLSVPDLQQVEAADFEGEFDSHFGTTSGQTMSGMNEISKETINQEAADILNEADTR